MIICIPVHAYIIFNVSNMTLLRYRDGDTYDHSLYNCTIDSILLHSFLLIYHPYPPSFHEMIFTLVPLSFLVEASLERQGAPKMRHTLPRCFDWKVQRFCWPKGTSLECVESLYVKTTGAACVSEELCR